MLFTTTRNGHTYLESVVALLLFSLIPEIAFTRSYCHPPPPSNAPSLPPNIWHPSGRMSWQWQLTGRVDLAVNASVYDIDLFDTPASVVAALHAAGRKAICYIDFGTWENWRADAGRFPAFVKGKPSGWRGELWLDIREESVLAPILEARLDLCRAKGFDGVEPDNIDGYSHLSGFPLTYRNQVTFNKWIAGAAHARGLSVGLKNDLAQIPDLLSSFDWALSEQCFQYAECDALLPFLQSGKAVFEVEYNGRLSRFCPATRALGLNSLKKHFNLDAWRESCPP